MATENKLLDDFLDRSIALFAGTYAPKGWISCDGRILNREYLPDLFSILGTTYGGDGITTFGAPDLTPLETDLKEVRHIMYCNFKDSDFYLTDFTGTVIQTTDCQESEDWKCCNGQLLNVQDYVALFQLCGIRWGGDGLHNFALPDLREAAAKTDAKSSYMICVKGLFPAQW